MIGYRFLLPMLPGFRARYPEIDVTLTAAPVPARGRLTEFSEHGSLVVIGARGHGVVGRLVGSVSQHVLHSGHCPVAVVH